MKIYVVTHENINLTLPADYELFQVGAAVNGAFCEHNDAVGEDNISAKNPNYSSSLRLIGYGKTTMKTISSG